VVPGILFNLHKLTENADLASCLQKL